MIGIYKITNKINNKIYIGQSIDIKERWKQHFYKAYNKKELGYNSAIHQAFRKYGYENFSFEVIEVCKKEELDAKEIYWIKTLNSLTPNGYNILPGGQLNRASTRQLFCSKCGKEISSSNSSGLCRSCAQEKVSITKEELYEKLLENEGNFTKVGAFYGITDNAIRKKCKNFNLSYHSSDYKQKKEKKPCQRQVIQIDKNTKEIIHIYKSIAEAARAVGASKGSHITEACQGKLKTAHGFCWQYY